MAKSLFILSINSQYQSMNEQLKRIKSKDFSQLDQKIYQDKHRVEDLGSTLLHLSDFQKFLIEQIANMDKNQPNANSNLIAKSIARNFDHLKESLVKCSRIQERPIKGKVIGLKEQLYSLKEQLKHTKNNISQKIKEASLKNSETIEVFLQGILGKLDNQRKKNEELDKRYQQILNQNERLKKENQQLKTTAANSQKENIMIIDKVQYIPSKVYTEASLRTPLKQTDCLERANSNFAAKEQGWKITRNLISNGLHNDSIQKRNSSLKRQTSNHQLSRKSHINCLRDKQNESLALKSKGVAVEELKRGRSKQKIKLFSMI